jgi:hypothetical protein
VRALNEASAHNPSGALFGMKPAAMRKQKESRRRHTKSLRFLRPKINLILKERNLLLDASHVPKYFEFSISGEMNRERSQHKKTEQGHAGGSCACRS